MISDAAQLACRYPPELALIRYLAHRNYYHEYQIASWGGLVPRGMSGAELLALSKQVQKENQLQFKQDPMLECARRGAL